VNYGTFLNGFIEPLKMWSAKILGQSGDSLGQASPRTFLSLLTLLFIAFSRVTKPALQVASGSMTVSC
jgi:hypothetical protein